MEKQPPSDLTVHLVFGNMLCSEACARACRLSLPWQIGLTVGLMSLSQK
jgi:hypothetical protein